MSEDRKEPTVTKYGFTYETERGEVVTFAYRRDGSFAIDVKGEAKVTLSALDAAQLAEWIGSRN